jgi:hypothetical protein
LPALSGREAIAIRPFGLPVLKKKGPANAPPLTNKTAQLATSGAVNLERIDSVRMIPSDRKLKGKRSSTTASQRLFVVSNAHAMWNWRAEYNGLYFAAAVEPRATVKLFDADFVSEAQGALPESRFLRRQNRKYRCAIGSTLAGSQVSSSPSARTS